MWEDVLVGWGTVDKILIIQVGGKGFAVSRVGCGLSDKYVAIIGFSIPEWIEQKLFHFRPC